MARNTAGHIWIPLNDPSLEPWKKVADLTQAMMQLGYEVHLQHCGDDIFMEYTVASVKSYGTTWVPVPNEVFEDYSDFFSAVEQEDDPAKIRTEFPL